MSKRRQRVNKINGPFVPMTLTMLQSPAMRVLSLSARRCLARIEIEHLRHGGRDNGRLPVTYNDFVGHGVDRDAIGPAIREAVALGFIEITVRGRAGNGEFRRANFFRLTYLPSRKRQTNEWQNITTIEQGEQLAKAARKENHPKNTGRGFPQNQSGFPRPVPVGVSPTIEPKHQSGFPRLLSRSSPSRRPNGGRRRQP